MKKDSKYSPKSTDMLYTKDELGVPTKQLNAGGILLCVGGAVMGVALAGFAGVYLYRRRQAQSIYQQLPLMEDGEDEYLITQHED